jgi:hypothetical protein
MNQADGGASKGVKAKEGRRSQDSQTPYRPASTDACESRTELGASLGRAITEAQPCRDKCANFQ